MSYQKTHSSHSLRQPLAATTASEASVVGETTSIDDYHHHQHHGGGQHEQAVHRGHSSLSLSRAAAASSQRESASPASAASAYQYRTQQKPSSVLASELNSPDLILPAAALAQAQAAAAASATSKGGGVGLSGGYSINSLSGRGGHGHQSYEEVLLATTATHQGTAGVSTGTTTSRGSTEGSMPRSASAKKSIMKKPSTTTSAQAASN